MRTNKGRNGKKFNKGKEQTIKKPLLCDSLALSFEKKTYFLI
jgi:hypothetical protein